MPRCYGNLSTVLLMRVYSEEENIYSSQLAKLVKDPVANFSNAFMLWVCCIQFFMFSDFMKYADRKKTGL